MLQINQYEPNEAFAKQYLAEAQAFLTEGFAYRAKSLIEA
jgi:hypothetical protein